MQPAKFTWYISRSSNMNNERMAVLLGFFRGHTVYPTLYQLELESMEFLEGYSDVQFDTSIYRLNLIIRGRNNYYKYANSIDSINKKYTLGLLKKKILLINERYRHDKKTKKDLYEPDAFENYSYKVKFSTSSEIEDIIKNKDKKYVLGVRLGNDLGSGVFIFDVDTGFYLGSFDKKGWPGAIRSKDVEILEDKINEQ